MSNQGHEWPSMASNQGQYSANEQRPYDQNKRKYPSNNNQHNNYGRPSNMYKQQRHHFNNNRQQLHQQQYFNPSAFYDKSMVIDPWAQMENERNTST
jgi:hypothetical protein